MPNGRYDHAFTAEGFQNPLFRLPGAPEADKRHVLFDTGHDAPRKELIKEVQVWLERQADCAATDRRTR
jgi:hypothetical protein